MKVLDFAKWKAGKADKRFRPLLRAGVNPDGWMFMGEHDGWTTYKKWCDHDEHGGKEYLTLSPDGAVA